MPAITVKEVIEIIKTALDETDKEITLDTTSMTLPQWDSLGQINIILGLDEAIGGISSIEEMATAGSVAQIVDILTAQGMIRSS